jgi:hypothetical protein
LVKKRVIQKNMQWLQALPIMCGLHGWFSGIHESSFGFMAFLAHYMFKWHEPMYHTCRRPLTIKPWLKAVT